MFSSDVLLSECFCLGRGVELEQLNVGVAILFCCQYSTVTSARRMESQSSSVQCQYLITLLDKVNTKYGGLGIGAGSKVNELSEQMSPSQIPQMPDSICH